MTPPTPVVPKHESMTMDMNMYFPSQNSLKSTRTLKRMRRSNPVHFFYAADTLSLHPSQIHTLVILPTRQLGALITFIAIVVIFDLEHASQLLARNHVLLSCAGAFAEWVWCLVPAVWDTGYTI